MQQDALLWQNFDNPRGVSPGPAVTCPGWESCIKIPSVGINRLFAIATLSLLALVSLSPGQARNANANLQLGSSDDEDDGLAIISAALDLRVNLKARQDCSHLVHTIYEQAGFPYPYAKSTDLYKGVESFQRVDEPLPGDLIVWRGHVGIVVNPARHAFFSSLRSGLGVDDYEAQYWRKRGHPRFYRYTSDTPLQDVSARDHAIPKRRER